MGKRRVRESNVIHRRAAWLCTGGQRGYGRRVAWLWQESSVAMAGG